MLDVPDISTQTFRTIFSEQETDTDQFNLSASWVKNESVSVKFGVGVMSTKMHALHSETQDFLGGWGVGFNPAGQSDIPDPSLLTQINVLNSLNDLSHDGYPDTEHVSGQWLLHDDARPGVIPRRPLVVCAGDGGNPLYPNWDTANLTPAAYDNNTIEEDIYSAYVQAKFDGEIGGLATQTVVGLRYEQTDVEADAQQNIVDRFLWTSDNDFQRVFGTDLTALGDKADYNNFLPNIDFSVALNDTMKVRASVSQTIARPQYNNLFMTTAVNGPAHADGAGRFPDG